MLLTRRRAAALLLPLGGYAAPVAIDLAISEAWSVICVVLQTNGGLYGCPIASYATLLEIHRFMAHRAASAWSRFHARTIVDSVKSIYWHAACFLLLCASACACRGACTLFSFSDVLASYNRASAARVSQRILYMRVCRTLAFNMPILTSKVSSLGLNGSVPSG